MSTLRRRPFWTFGVWAAKRAATSAPVHVVIGGPLTVASNSGDIAFVAAAVSPVRTLNEMDESPGVTGLGVLSGRVQRLPAGVKHPQMQWNQVDLVSESPLFDGLGERPWMYFVHSFAPEVTGDVIGTCDYGGAVTAAVQHEMVFATQFHPEKSGTAGLALLRNFVRLAATATVS